MPNGQWSELQNTQQNSTKLSAMLGEDERTIQEIFHTKHFNSD